MICRCSKETKAPTKAPGQKKNNFFGNAKKLLFVEQVFAIKLAFHFYKQKRHEAHHY